MLMGTLRALTALAACLLGVRGFNLDVHHPIIYQGSQRGDYFGFDLGLHPGSKAANDESWLMVGAPKSNNSFPMSGIVYKCQIKDQFNCLQLNFHEEAPNNYKRVPGSEMLGSVIDMTSDRFVVCRPGSRVEDIPEGTKTKTIRLYGSCYWGLSKNPEEADDIMPLAGLKKDKFLVNGIYRENHIYGQAGFSAYLYGSSSRDYKMMLGAPGVKLLKGSVATFEDGGDMGNVLQRRRRRSALDAFASGPFIPDFSEIKQFKPRPEWETKQYLGYAVTAGKFFSRSGVTFAAGAPADSLTGKVYVYESYNPSKFKVVLEGQQPGEFFGSSLAVGDIDNDNRDDLIVGAPQFTLNETPSSQNEGRVFVFYGSITGEFDAQRTQIIQGEVKNGRLGTSVACVGDLDQDGYQDFAFGAPYNGSGVVFIYRGSANGLILSQKIVGSELTPRLTGFGFAISRGQDVDGNGFKDVAIGAYSSGHAVVLRSKPVIDLDVDIEIVDQGLGLSFSATSLSADFCVKQKGFDRDINVTMKLNMDPLYHRVFRKGVSGSITETIFTSQECFRLEFSLMQQAHANYKPVKLVAEFTLPTEPKTTVQPIFGVTERRSGVRAQKQTDGFCAHCPLLRMQTVTKWAEIGFNFGCKIPSDCKAAFNIEMHFSRNNKNISSLVVGADDEVSLKVTVTNNGDPALNSKLVLTQSALLGSPPTGCEVNQSNVVCDTGNPFPGNASNRQFVFKLDLDKVANESLNIQAWMESLTPSENNATASKLISLPLSYQADVSVDGKSWAENYRFELEQNTSIVNVATRYQVEKSGPTPLQEVSLWVDVPVALADGTIFSGDLQFFKPRRIKCENIDSRKLFKNIEPISKVTAESEYLSKYPANRTLYVSCSSSEYLCTRLACKVYDLATEDASVDLKMKIDMRVLDKKLGLKDIVVLLTKATVKIVAPIGVEQPVAQRADVSNVSIVLMRSIPLSKVALWIIILAIIGGILLLTALTVALFKNGFFQRRQRDELMKSKTEASGEMNGIVAVQGVDNQTFNSHNESLVK